MELGRIDDDSAPLKIMIAIWEPHWIVFSYIRAARNVKLQRQPVGLSGQLLI